MKAIAVIPARAGSQRLPGKNRRKLGGVPLINWSIQFAKKLKFIDDIVISTNDSIIIKKNKRNKFLKVFTRPRNLSGKNIKTIDVILHVIKKYEKFFDKVETILLLQTTSPFRSKSKIYYAYKEYKKCKKKKSIISVSKTNFPQKRNFEIKNNNLFYLKYDGKKKKEIYQANGNFYIASSFFLKKYKSFYFKKKTCPMVLKSTHLSIDIDTRKDFLIAERFLRNNRKKKKVINN